MRFKNKFSSKPKVLTFDDALKAAQPPENKPSAKAQSALQKDAQIDLEQINKIENSNQDQEIPVYKGVNLYRFNNKDHARNAEELNRPTTVIYGGRSTDYDIWREENKTYVRHKVGKLFEDVLVGNENIRFNDKFLNHNDPNIGSKPPVGRIKRVSQEHINGLVPQKEFFNFNQNKAVEYDYVYNDITKKLERQKNIEILEDKQENSIKNLTATGDVNSLSATYIEAGNILDYIQWKK